MKIKKINLPEKCRVICVSDIHGHYDDFVKLLNKCQYNSEDDYIFILGDILEKGVQNIQVLQYIKDICENSKVICIKGNNDTMCERMAYTDSKEKFFSRLKNRPNNTFIEMAKSIGIDNFEENFSEKRKQIINAFSAELEFLMNLPLAIETDNHIFVHAGIENRLDWENSDEKIILCKDWFLREKHCLDKYVVVGHYPTYNFARSNNTNLPIIDYNKKIIGIDGGCSVRWAGQLNAFIINKSAENYKYDTIFQPLAPQRKVKKNSITQFSYTYLNYQNSDLQILEKNGEFLKVKNIANGKIGKIPACCTGEWDGKLHGWINLDSFVSVKADEEYYVYGEIGEYYFGICQNGEVGLVPTACID